MKKYNSRFYDDVDKALEDCNNHQDWNVINIYPTGWREEVGIVYYIRTDVLKQEWSEEDKKMIIEICQNLYDYPRIKSPFDDELFNKAQKEVQFIKSLNPNSQWKPSIAQLNALSIVSKGNITDDIEAIVSLYNDLKKLREE